MLKLLSEILRIFVEGFYRVWVIKYLLIELYFLVEVEEYKENEIKLEDDFELEVFIRNVVGVFEEFVRFINKILFDVILFVIII